MILVGLEPTAPRLRRAMPYPLGHRTSVVGTVICLHFFPALLNLVERAGVPENFCLSGRTASSVTFIALHPSISLDVSAT